MRRNRLLVVVLLGLFTFFAAAVVPAWMGNAIAEEEKEEVKATPEQLEKGKKVYTQICSGCHGLKGDGKGPVAMALTPKPADFTDDEWKYGGSAREVYDVIMNGVPGTAMAPFGAQLSEGDRWSLVHYLRSLSQK